MALEALSALNLTIQLAVTWYMVGLIWFVQRVHYPLFARVREDVFGDYEADHVRRTGPVVGPAMALEAAGAALLVASLPPRVPAQAAWLGLGLVAILWLSTLLLQVPRHRDLAAGFGAEAHRRLVTTNWIRTAAWTLRGLLVGWIALRAGSAGP